MVLWQHRELVRNLVTQELKVRYRNSALGFAWSLLNPLLMMLVFTVVFTVLLDVGPRDVPYPLFVLSGLLPWLLFTTSVAGSNGSIVGNAGLVTRIAFPREVLPVSVILANTINFLLALGVLAPVLVVLGGNLSVAWVTLPVVLLLQIVTIAGISLMVSALNVYFRDIGVILDVILQMWLFLTPVFYDGSQLSRGGQTGLIIAIDLLNPMARIVRMYRAILLQGAAPDMTDLAYGLVVAVGTYYVGHIVFQRLSSSFGDIL